MDLKNQGGINHQMVAVNFSRQLPANMNQYLFQSFRHPCKTCKMSPVQNWKHCQHRAEINFFLSKSMSLQNAHHKPKSCRQFKHRRQPILLGIYSNQNKRHSFKKPVPIPCQLLWNNCLQDKHHRQKHYANFIAIFFQVKIFAQFFPAVKHYVAVQHGKQPP